MPRKSRLLQLEVVHQVADATFPIEQQRHDLDPDRIGQSMKELRGSLGVDWRRYGHGGRVNKFS